MKKVNIEQSWYDLLQDEFEQDYFKEITQHIKKDISDGNIIYPEPKQIFRAMDLCSVDKVKVVILWQDPYHTPWVANWLCFSVNPGKTIPPSLVNIQKEISNNGYKPLYTDGDLTPRAEQWVLLLNAVLTVISQQPLSHQNIWRQTFTDEIIKKLSDEKNWLVFMLWWSYARSKAKIIDQKKHLILEAVHPSPLSANRGGRFGCEHFYKCNQYLAKQGKKEIIW